MNEPDKTDDLLERISREFPQTSWTTAVAGDGGWDHTTVILDGSLVFRCPHGDEEPGYFRREIAVLERVAGYTSTRIPTVSLVSSDALVMAYPYLPGVQLAGDRFERLDETAKRNVTEQLAAFLSDLHAIPLGACTDLQLPDRKPEYTLSWLRAGMDAELRPILSEADCDTIDGYFNDLELCMRADPDHVLLHGDLGLDDVIVDHDQRISVIDFSDCATGDPAFDFAGLLSGSQSLATSIWHRYAHKGRFPGVLERADVYNGMIPISLMTHARMGTYDFDFDAAYRDFTTYFSAR